MMKIAILGVGLIGGSLALCFKGKPGLEIVGHSPNPASVEKYVEHNVVDSATVSLEEAAADADFIFLGVPVGSLEMYLRELQQLPLKQGCIITDVGGAKGAITDYAEQMDFGDAYFIGGHPMAGSEKSGVEAASAHLFENAFYVLTPTSNVPQEVYERLVNLLGYTKAQIIRVEAGLHDDIVGAVSHLPHVIVAALVNLISGYNSTNPLYENLAAGGFRDFTRIASSEPVLWRDNLLNNREVMLKLLDDWNAEIAKFSELIRNNDGKGVEAEFYNAKQFRSQLPERKKGLLTSVYDIYVDVPDNPGIIGQIATLLGDHRINLSNIQIIESREDVPGVLRLSFRNEREMDRALEQLKPIYDVRF